MSEQKKGYYQEVCSIFNKLALAREGYYDAKNNSSILGHTIWQYLNRWQIISILNRLQQKRILRSCLDAGCGMGDFTYQLCKRYHYQQVHGIDFSEEMLQLGQRKYGQQTAAFLSFSRQNLAQRLAFQDRAFDLSLCLNALHHLLPDDQKRLIHELCRVSRQLVILEIKRYHFLQRLLTGYKAMGHLKIYPTSIADVVTYFQQAGYTLLLIRPIFFLIWPSPIALLVFSRKDEPKVFD